MSFDIAVIGLSNRFPGAPDKQAFWSLLEEGRQSFTRLDRDALCAAGTPADQLDAPNFVPVASKLDDVESFDADFFGIPGREALLLDPQHRLFLECVWEAFEDAGIDPARSRSIGVFAGASLNTYLIRNLACNPHLLTTPGGFLSLISNEKDYLANRVSYRFGLTGPAVTVQTACSTSLVAAHMAIQSLIFGECDVAIAGGVSVKIPQEAGYLHQEGMPFSADGTCRSFDAAGSGTVFGSGAGVVLLKPLAEARADGDDIYCVIRASAMNNDGDRKVGFTAPSVDGQAEVIRRAVILSDCDPATIGYVEAHATATPLGDPIEVAALGEVYGRGRSAPLRMGSVKSNIGHMETAAGIAGLIKLALMLRHRRLVPSAGYDTPNPHIDFAGGALAVQTAAEPWQATGPRRAGLSSFGIGGTNVHMVLEEAPDAVARDATERDWHLFVLSARSDAALKAQGARLAGFISANPGAQQATIAANLQTRRAHLTHRHAFLARDAADAEAKARRQVLDDSFFGVAPEDRPRVAFAYCGGGAQYPAMFSGLMSEPVFARSVRDSAEAFAPLIGHDLIPMLDGAVAGDEVLARKMQRPDLMFPALFTVQNAMGDLLESWGLVPDLVIGHSNGEYASAVRAGVMSRDTAIRLVAARSTLMMTMPEGGMISVPADEATVADFARDHGLSVGAANAPDNTALSGEAGAIDAALAACRDALGCEAKPLHVGAALHSHLTRLVADDFAAAVAKETFDAPKLRWISSVTGTFMDPAKPPQPQYWVDHLTSTVRFRAAAETYLGQGRSTITLDIGPGRVAGDLLRQNDGYGRLTTVQAARGFRETTPDTDVALAALAKAWALGADVDFRRFAGDGPIRKLDLPSYAWQRKRYWIDPPETAGAPADLEAALSAATLPQSDGAGADRPLLTSPYVAPATDTETRLLTVWTRFLGDKRIGTADDFIELGGTSLLATEVVGATNTEFGVTLELGAFLEAKTIAATARVVDALVAESDARLLQEALAEIEGKSDEELNALLKSA